MELVRSVYAGWVCGDFSSTAWADPQIDFVIADGPVPGRWTGVAGMAAGWRGVLGAFKDLRAGAEEYRELGGGRVLALAHSRARGRVSEVELAEALTKHAALFHVQGGKVIRLVVYFDRRLALAEVGLTSEAS